jgi:hypothetical protein
MFGLPPPQGMIYIISLSALVLGFIALLTQKVYIDSATGQVTEIEVRTIGKLKTNIPALVFVVGGLVLATFAFLREPRHPMPWIIEGTLLPADGESPLTGNEMNDLAKGIIGFQPSRLVESPSIDKTKFHFRYEIPEGEEFEDDIDVIQYQNGPDFTGTILVRKTDPVAKGSYYRKYNLYIERKAGVPQR